LTIDLLERVEVMSLTILLSTQRFFRIEPRTAAFRAQPYLRPVMCPLGAPTKGAAVNQASLAWKGTLASHLRHCLPGNLLAAPIEEAPAVLRFKIRDYL
jgi:hypothetical protein